MSVPAQQPATVPAADPAPPRLTAHNGAAAVPATLQVEGGVALCGEVTVGGSKNEVLPALCASLLTGGPVVLHNVPRLLDVEVLLQILTHMGARVSWTGPHTVCVQARALVTDKVPELLGRRLRASVLLAGPLLARLGRVQLPLPGGDAIGRRRLDVHTQGLTAMGARLWLDGTLTLSGRPVGADLFLDEPSVTGTENLLMAAVLARGTTVIRHAAQEPHVQGLCRMLQGMGARIRGVGTGTLSVEGVSALHGVEHTVGPDMLEAVTLAAAGLMTRGRVAVRGIQGSQLRGVQAVWRKLGARLTLVGSDVMEVDGRAARAAYPEVLGGTPRVDDGPWPAFPTDLMSVTLALATQGHGNVLFFEKMYDGRLLFTEQLGGMGAQIILCDPHRAVVCGPSRLVGRNLRCPDVRAGVALLLAALCAHGQSTLTDIHHVDRGHAGLEDRLAALGAHVQRVPPGGALAAKG